MGIPWDIQPWGNDCPCWPANRTPAFVYASISGIQCCIPPPFSLPCPNGIFQLTQDPFAACKFVFLSPNWMITYQSGGGQSQFIVQSPIGFSAFAGSQGNNCRFDFSSIQSCSTYPPQPLWGGGSAVVLSIGNDPLPSLQEFAALLNLVKDQFSMADFWPSSVNSEVCIRYARKETPTNILMKIDYSEYDQYDMFDWY